MAKIILTLNGEVLREVELSKERITIGRAPHNDLVIDNRAVSGEHVVIVTVNDDSFLEDLNSTNGTQVNGQPIKKHFLREDDVVELAQYRLQYLAGSRAANGEDPERRLSAAHTMRERPASIKILNGPSAGRETAITKALTTIGRPDAQVAAITRRPEGYYLAHVEGGGCPLVNGQAIGPAPQALTDGDVIALAGIAMRFALR